VRVRRVAVAAALVVVSILMLTGSAQPFADQGSGAAAGATRPVSSETSLAPKIPPPLVTLKMTKTASRAQVDFGESFDFFLTVENLGPDTALDTVVDDALPAQVAVISTDCGASVNEDLLTWDVGDLAVGSSTSCTLTVRVVATGSIVNQAVARARNSQRYPEATASAFVQGPSVLEVPTLSRFAVGILMLALAVVGSLALRGPGW